MSNVIDINLQAKNRAIEDLFNQVDLWNADKEDVVPVALVLAADDDAKGFITHRKAVENLGVVAKTHRIVLQIIDSGPRIQNIIEDVTNEGMIIDVVIIKAHGRIGSITFGDPKIEPPFQLKDVHEGLFERLPKHAKILLHSCYGQAMARKMAEVAGNREVTGAHDKATTHSDFIPKGQGFKLTEKDDAGKELYHSYQRTPFSVWAEEGIEPKPPKEAVVEVPLPFVAMDMEVVEMEP
jgi:hypothetical protein